MSKFFQVSKAYMAGTYRLAGLPEGDAVTFPVLNVETNMIGGKGFDAFITLDTSGHPELLIGSTWVVGAYRGQFVDAPKPVVTRKYHIVVGINKTTNRTEMLFGDYDKECAQDERDDLKEGQEGDEYRNIRVITLNSDNQAAIDAKIAELNNK